MSGLFSSVVILTYNRGKRLPQAIQSVLNQTQLPDEIIVVDDGSTDDTYDLLDPFRKKICYLYQEHEGTDAARKRGLQAAVGEVIAFLDGDHVWHPRKLELQFRTLKERDELGLLGTFLFDCGISSFPPLESLEATPLCDIPEAASFPTDCWQQSSVLLSRWVLDQAQESSTTRLDAGEDSFWSRVGAVAPAAVLPIPLTGIRLADSRVCIPPSWLPLNSVERRSPSEGEKESPCEIAGDGKADPATTPLATPRG